MSVQSYRDLVVWQKAMRLGAEAYRLSRLLPKAEEYRLTSQLLRAAASVPANIAEGHARGTRKDYAHFISIARGSLAETETILLLLVDVELLSNERVQAALALSAEIGRMLNGLPARLRDQPDP
ncbi:MAG TPA: four helix bundle protein [Hyphomicrobiaceae bacterium]|nr:four helix bundle protein [Hyphomicrobiaceae bacterium]